MFLEPAGTLLAHVLMPERLAPKEYGNDAGLRYANTVSAQLLFALITLTQSGGDARSNGI